MEKSKDDPFDLVDKENINDVSDTLFDQPPATKIELWSYYLYYNGVSPAYHSLITHTQM